MNQPGLRVAYLTSFDPRDRRSCSGLLYYMAEALRGVGAVHLLGPLETRWRTLGQRVDAWSRRWLHRAYEYEAGAWLARRYARLAEARLRGLDANLVFAPLGSGKLAYLRTRLPVAYWTDTTAAAFFRTDDGRRMARRTLPGWRRAADRLERRAIRRADALLFTHQTAADSAVRDYGADPARVHVLSFGANLDVVPAREELRPRDTRGPCRLLFLSAGWERRGGPLALETLLALRAAGRPAELIICGCRPPDPRAAGAARVLPFLDKNDPAQRARYYELLKTSHFLLMPSRTDLGSFTFAEANAFGLPVIATDTGRRPAAVTDGVNGYMLPLSAGPEAYACLVQEAYGDPARYAALEQGARRVYEQEFTWEGWAQRVRPILEALVAAGPRRTNRAGAPA